MATLRISFTPAENGQPDPKLAVTVTPLLEIALARVSARGAYVYRFDADDPSLRLAAWMGDSPGNSVSLEVHVTGARAVWHGSFQAPIVLESNGWTDWRFQDFPEFAHNRFEAVVAVPLIDAGQLVGVAHFCRREAKPYSVPEVQGLRQLAATLSALIMSGKLRAELDKVSRQLADRKILDRAKGILQARFGWTEEESYLYLRRNSRTRRLPLRQIATEIVDRTTGREGTNAAD